MHTRKKKKVLRFIEHLQCIRHNSRYLMYMVSFHPFNNQVTIKRTRLITKLL